VNAHFDSSQLSAEIKSQMLQFKERYNSALKELHGQVRTAQRTAEEFGNLIGEYRQGVLGGGQAGETSFGQHPSFADFLQSLKRTWSGVAVNEREALEKAVYYYKEAFANGRDIAPGNQQIQASYLIAELSRRIGDYDEAKQYFTSTIKSGQEFIYQNRQDSSRIALAKKILELAIEQGRQNLAAARPA
jgi:tetratricopeptide (TPR) repeat protein